MRWVTTVWMSAALLMATTALHLTVEHNLQVDQESLPALDTYTKQDTFYMVNGSQDETTEDVTAENLARNLMKLYSSSGESNSKSSSAESDSKSRSKTSETSGDKENGPSDSNDNVSSHRIQISNGDLTDEPEEPDNGNEPENPESVNLVPNPAITDTTLTDGITDTTITDLTTTEVTEQSTINSPVPETSANDQSTASTPENEGSTSSLDPDIIIETSTGSVRGHLWRENTNIISYIDIKYGTFNNPFEAPVVPEPDEDSIHEERVHTKRCPQLQGDERVGEVDCLTLSIFKPSKEALTGASVLVHIHEGNFMNESADPEIYGPEYLVSEEIILVLPNYRLGPLGFLCLQNDTAPGNAALKDLALALSWIKENIEKFGGDPDNIAVSGEGTAGALAGYLALSPLSKSNVNKVITESGAVLSHWAIDRNPTRTATVLATSIPGSWASWETIDMTVLLVAARDFHWSPCLEIETENGVHFMIESPWRMIQKDDIKATFMIGSAEYAGVHESLQHTATSIEQLNANHSLLLPNDLQFRSSEERDRVASAVKALYYNEAEITLNNAKNRTLYYTDMAYLGPGLRTTRSLVESGATVYFYEFSFVGDLNREFMAVEKRADGAVRGDIIGYLFYQEGDMSDVGEKEKNMIEQMIQLWTSFIKTGTPEANEIEWNKFEKGTPAEEQMLSIGEETAMKTGVHVARLELWTEIYNEHFIENLAVGVAPSVYTVLILQVAFFMTFFKHAGHFF